MDFAISCILVFGFMIVIACWSNLEEKKPENEGIVL